MPYKDPDKKKEWESRHQMQRIARRRELRQIEVAWKEAHPEAVGTKAGGSAILLPIVAGGTLAAWSPPLAIGVGGLTAAVASLYKKAWSWWVVALVILAAGLFFRWNENEGGERNDVLYFDQFAGRAIWPRP